ncbi:ELL-associated factor 1 [Tetranychus urticae]|uniref:Ell-associated factor Eaf n=1 Tax=Tetranychus urticae TaxID=32264 RepID=T1K0K6_TETUR|nr:ELL-associated factor 1 [Tetranychus urticae]
MAKLTNGIGLGGETRQLVLGDSFRNYRCNRGPKGLHTVRYDFKPASVDTTKVGDIEFGENNKVTVTMPNVESAGFSQTVFKGSRKPHLKECVLIIDNETGELTLERLAHNITVKKTRAEGSSRAGLPRPITPSFETQNEKSGSSSNSNGNNGNGNNSSYNNNSNNNYNQRKLSPPMINGSINGGRPISPKVSSSSLTVGGHHGSLSQGGSPSSFTPKSNRSSPNVAFGLHRSPLVQSSQPSMPTNDLLTSTHIKPDDEMIGILSESSSDSSEHGSSSSDNSDSSSDEDDEIKQEVVEASKSLNDDNYSRAGSSSSSGSDSSSDSDDETGPATPTPMMTNSSKIKQSPNNGSSSSAILPSMPSMLSMPKFTQLSEDLQLSESGSDSD